MRKNEQSMSFRIASLLANGLLPLVPAGFLLAENPETDLIPPWPIVWTLLGVNLLLILLARKRMAPTRRQRQTETLLSVVDSFIPLATFYSVFPADASLPVSLQLLLYCTGQVVWIVSVRLAPDWAGRIRQRKAEERALTGKQRFESRKEVLEKQKRKSDRH